MDPDPGHFLKIYWFFFAYFYPKTWWTIYKWGNFYNLYFFSKVQIWVLWVKKFFFAVFGWYFTPWIRIRGSAYCGSRKPNFSEPTEPDPKPFPFHFCLIKKHQLIFEVYRGTNFRISFSSFLFFNFKSLLSFT